MRHENLRFYFTVASGSSRKALREAERDDTETTDDGREVNLGAVPEPESVMVSATTKMNRPWAGPEWFIDSGGYSTLDATGEYETTPEEYVAYLAEHEAREGVEIARYALRDWACERKLLRDNDRNVRVHQNWTIRDHFECLELADERGIEAEPVPVLQGHDLREYLRHLDYYRDHGLLDGTTYLGIGSVCKRENVAEIRDTLERLREEVPSEIRLHGFGITRELLYVPEAVEALDSVDTAGWERKAFYNAIENASTGDNRYTWDRVLDSYVGYRERTTEILDGLEFGSGQRTRVMSLSDYVSGADDREEQTRALIECVCGSLLDPDAPDVHEARCRHCDRTKLNLQMAQMGLLGDGSEPECAAARSR